MKRRPRQTAGTRTRKSHQTETLLALVLVLLVLPPWPSCGWNPGPSVWSSMVLAGD